MITNMGVYIVHVQETIMYLTFKDQWTCMDDRRNYMFFGDITLLTCEKKLYINKRYL